MSGCTGAGVVATNDGGASATPRWTVFVYGNADHNLSPSLETDIAKMSQAVLGPNVTVVVEADFDAQRVRAGRTERFPAGTSWFRIRGNNMEPDEILHEAEKSLDDPSELTAGVRYAFSHYPADRYAVILWDHGGGWSGGYGGDGQDGTVAQPAGMSGEAAAAAIRAAMNDLGRTGTRPLEFVAFDTCLMAAPEIIQPFRELASVYIANAEIDFGAGWNYAATLSYIAAHPAATAQTIGAQEVRDWDTLHSAMGVSDVELRSHIAIDLTKFDAFAAAMRTLDDALSAMTTPLADVARVGFTTRPQYSISFESDIPAPQFRDLGQFLGALSSMRGAPPSLAQAVGPVQTALNAMTLGVSQGTLRAAAGQSGIHIGLPLPASYTPAVASGYASRAGQWATASHWDRVLTAMTPGGVAAPDIATMGATAINTMSPTASALPTVQIMPRGDVVLGYSTVLAVTADATVFQVREPADEEDLTAGAAASFTWSGQLPEGSPQIAPKIPRKTACCLTVFSNAVMRLRRRSSRIAGIALYQ